MGNFCLFNSGAHGMVLGMVSSDVIDACMMYLSIQVSVVLVVGLVIVPFSCL